MSPLLIVGLLVCLVAAVTDLRTGRIPNALTLPALALAPPAHVAWSLLHGAPISAALWLGASSLGGLALCAIVPLVMWRLNTIGGGDVKLFAALGALALPSIGFEAEVYVLLAACLLAPVQLIYRGTLLRAAGNIGSQLANVFRNRAQRKALDPAQVSWFRLGPCFALGFAVELVLHGR